jgi:hypothetical protein
VIHYREMGFSLRRIHRAGGDSIKYFSWVVRERCQSNCFIIKGVRVVCAGDKIFDGKYVL